MFWEVFTGSLPLALSGNEDDQAGENDDGNPVKIDDVSLRWQFCVLAFDREKRLLHDSSQSRTAS